MHIVLRAAAKKSCSGCQCKCQHAHFSPLAGTVAVLNEVEQRAARAVDAVDQVDEVQVQGHFALKPGAGHTDDSEVGALCVQ